MVAKKVQVVPSFTYANLKQTSTKLITHNNDPHGPTTFTLTTHLPPYVFPFYWQHYCLSEKDILQQSEDIPAQYYWLAALLYGIEASASYIRPSFACLDEVLLSSKPNAIKKIIKISRIVLSQMSHLTNNTQSMHRPILPHVFLPACDLLRVQQLIFPGLKPFEMAQVPGLFEWHGHLYLPIALEEENILMNQVVLLEDYEASGKKKSGGFGSLPLIIEDLVTKSKYALTEECMFVSLQV